ncbi:MAG TPA: protocatechuate 3,4-dioxygenase [Ramlibacter sp.]|uniref:DODA-type extradiol aromatic ring-opening family dioxygenase n=1 Tax=Ramlibacter sp. TaxID=1917967 RepID=UPI002D8024BB|nr:protocatechuate 3,4-dioxygenase [Ramlibacter sp.]HET8748472.1 protocatechuate 3,4-dioxygenase [Ramlibacter sp.]
MLNAPVGDWARFIERDRTRAHLTKEGCPVTYEELERLAPPGVQAELTPEVFADKHQRALAEVERLGAVVRNARLDTLIVVGDDQKELYDDDNMPAILVYRGQTIRNVPLASHPGPDWARAASAKYFERDVPRDYPVDAKLAEHLIAALMEDFDLSCANTLAEGYGEGHAFGFVHNRLLAGMTIPVLPIFLNTYFPPNQPTPGRCYRLGQAIRAAVESFPGDARVGVLASGGLSHFTVDPELDGRVVKALREKDARALAALPREQLNSGSSEIRNWICMAGAVEHLALRHIEYIPAYRTPAGTGTGLCFADWS